MEARFQGARVSNGLSMLVHQGPFPLNAGSASSRIFPPCARLLNKSMTDGTPILTSMLSGNALVEWFRREGRDYPWRRTTDPWHILVSELMLQQTTIPTVLGRYDRWMRQFPTPAHLAAVDEQTALRSWEGLGYYRRVRSLQAIAREIVNEFGGRFPDNAGRAETPAGHRPLHVGSAPLLRLQQGGSHCRRQCRARPGPH